MKIVGSLLTAFKGFPARYLFSFKLRHIKKIVALTVPVLVGIILLLGWMSAKKVREVVINDFNQQQLVLARHAASQIENSLNALKRELLLLSLSPSIQYFEKVFIDKRMAIAFSSIKEEGAFEIRYIEKGGKRVHLVNRDGYRKISPSTEDMNYLKWAGDRKNMGRILITEVFPPIPERNTGPTMSMMVPVWQVSVDEKHPVATNLFSGVMIFNIDVTDLIKRITSGIRSGKTGYAWVIDSKGTFLYHPELEFIGKNAFEARKEKKPTISFARINEIQKEMMLKGKEGTSWYISGWHRGAQGEIKKLIAYAPIRLNEGGNHIWSVAVVAPISEVEGAIHDIQMRQFIMEGIVIMAVIFGGLFIIAMILRWSSSLEREVTEKTGELKKREYQYRSLVEQADDIIFTISPEGTVINMNNYGCNFLRKELKDIAGRHLNDIFPHEVAQLLLKASNQVFSSNIREQITTDLVMDGKIYWLSINFSGLLDEAGNVYKVLAIGRDITERIAMQEQMLHTEKLASMGTLSAGIAHEINNPLAIILGFTDMLLEKTPPDSEFYDILKTIEKQGLKAKKVVESLLSFARAEGQKRIDVDINKNIEEVLSVAGNTLLVNKIKLNLDMAESLPQVRGDPDELHQVFLNIINNAVYAMKGGGILTISTRTVNRGRDVEIRISDTGCGIDKKFRSRIFDPLFTTKEVGEGTGLGLSVSYWIVKKHGGTITFETKTKEESEQPGTTFIITLPAINGAGVQQQK
ncbi:MAG: ATP-binding protein [Thermodesulfovibrionales bacterium]|nr:ATP-binding protein [Thermodesulfovibrionales bacterium]